MECLELKPVKNKKAVVYLIKMTNKELDNKVIKDINNFIKDNQINFINIDSERNLRDFKKTKLVQSIESTRVECVPVDIPEFAKGFLFEEILEKEEQTNALRAEYDAMEDKDSFKGQNLKSWIEFEEKEIKEKKAFLTLKLRPQWIVKQALDSVEACESDDVNFMVFVRDDVFTETGTLFADLEVKVVACDQNLNVLSQDMVSKPIIKARGV